MLNVALSKLGPLSLAPSRNVYVAIRSSVLHSCKNEQNIEIQILKTQQGNILHYIGLPLCTVVRTDQHCSVFG